MTEKEILMAAKRMAKPQTTCSPRLEQLSLDADIAATVHSPGSLQGPGGARLLSHSVLRETRNGIFPDCCVRSLQDSTFHRPGELLPGTKGQLGQQNKEVASIPEVAARLQENYSRLSVRLFPLFRFPISAKEEGGRKTEREGRRDGGRRRGNHSMQVMCLLRVAVGVAVTLLFASYPRRHNGFAARSGKGGNP